jgi:hypothetical protein
MLARRLVDSDDEAVIGAIIIVFVVVVAIPVAVLMSGAVLAAALGFALNDEVKREHEGSELVELNT